MHQWTIMIYWCIALQYCNDVRLCIVKMHANISILIDWGRVTLVCISKLSHHSFRRLPGRWGGWLNESNRLMTSFKAAQKHSTTKPYKGLIHLAIRGCKTIAEFMVAIGVGDAMFWNIPSHIQICKYVTLNCDAWHIHPDCKVYYIKQSDCNVS